MRTVLLRSYALVALVGLSHCGKKDKDSDASPAPQTTGTDGADGRIFGTWLMLEQSVIDEATAENIPGAKIRLSMTVAKDLVTSTTEMIIDDNVVCKAEASSSQFRLSADKIVFNETFSKETKIGEKSSCRTELKKGSLTYSFESNDVLKLKSDTDEQILKVNRLK